MDRFFLRPPGAKQLGEASGVDYETYLKESDDMYNSLDFTRAELVSDVKPGTRPTSFKSTRTLHLVALTATLFDRFQRLVFFPWAWLFLSPHFGVWKQESLSRFLSRDETEAETQAVREALRRIFGLQMRSDLLLFITCACFR